jgi:predicted acetyltransferase
MWRFVFDIDLIHTVETGHLPSDDPLLWLVAEPRRLHFKLSDGVWIRLVDVPAALTARKYAEDGRVVLDVTDAFCAWNEGRYALEVSGGEARCATTDEPADVACNVNEVASAYLGGASFAQLALAGRVKEASGGGLARADALFRSEPAPWCSLPF